MPGYAARIIGEDGREVAQGDAGVLQIHGQSGARAYWNKPEKTAETMLDGGWLDSGDTYVQDEEGYFVYEGRSDDMMKVGGIWTSPIEIEGRLLEHEKVMEAAVVAREDDAGLTKPEAWIIPQGPGRRRPGPGGGADRPPQGGAGPLQVPPLVELRRRPAQDRHRQDPALQTPERVREAVCGPLNARGLVTVSRQVQGIRGRSRPSKA